MTFEATHTQNPIELGLKPLSIAEVELIARGGLLTLSEDRTLRARLERGSRLLEQLSLERRVYGVNTGFGDSCEIEIPLAQRLQLPQNLLRFHGCGTGASFSYEQTRAIVVARISSLLAGASAVRPALIERMVQLLNLGLVPQMPSEGSVGASGDLTPLSYLAAVLTGDRELLTSTGQVVSASIVIERLGAFELFPKESLALMNGTSAMTGLACLCYQRASRLSRLASALTAMASDVMRGQPGHFDDRIFALKPHPGQRASARWIREDLELGDRRQPEPGRLQDRYSVRCAPHVIGVLLDNLPACARTITIELNSSNDNPLFDLETGDVLHGGNFYGGHICQAMDTLKTAVANIADLLDRQLALLCDERTNGGLPSNLVAPSAGPSHHGFKAMQITASALCAEALKLTMPASVFSRSTENHNQDKVSMGTIASRDCSRILDLVETLAAVHLLALCQAVDLRGVDHCCHRSIQLHASVRKGVAMNSADRRMDHDIQWLLDNYRQQALPIGQVDFPSELCLEEVCF